MKKNIFILLVGLLSCQLTVFAQEPSVKTIDVEIKSDTTIVVRDLFGADCKLYGDIILLENDKIKQRASQDGNKKDTPSYTKYGGDSETLFARYMKEANDGKEEYKNYVSRNDKGIVISLKYDNFPVTGLKLNFYGVLYDAVLVQKFDSKGNPIKTKNGNDLWASSEWYRDRNYIYCVSIIKPDEVMSTSATVEDVDSGKDSSVGDKAIDVATSDNNTDEHHSEQNDENQKLIEGILLILILLVISFFIVVFVRINKLNKRINTLLKNPQQSPLKSETINIETIKQTVISKIQSKDLAQRLSDEDIYNVINRSDIQLYIQTVIAGKVDEYLRNNKITNPVPADISSGYNQQPPVVQSELRTTKVEYRADNNCFVVSENSQNKIFEIYSINGEYYYTIVNDSSIRKEMLGFITAFSGYVETRQTSPIPSTVEVIRDGRLIKNGDMYIVDTNCILQVSLI